jgi:predicted ATPase/DNA-binding winged helix-turn-helix (wHTH) protein
LGGLVPIEAKMSVQLDSAVGERLKFGEFELAPIARALWRRGEQVRLGSRALDILIALASRPGEILSKDDLTKLVWRGALVDETALRVGISAVRKALGNGEGRYIATVPGRGYCFVHDVEPTTAKPAPEPPHFKRLSPQRLPAQIARVVGRDDVIAALAAEASRRRLVSLVGPGGIGKTTVAIAVADRLHTGFDAVTFVDLAPIENGTQMAAAAAAALGLNLRFREDPVDEIAVSVENRRVLIVLDNCEHLVDRAAAFVEALLASAQGITILATSRERLRAAGEWVHQLSPLDAPPESASLSAEEVRRYPAVEMFEERAACALGGYQISDTDAPYVAEICRRLDGIALAIELAAGRLAGLGVQGLASSLEDCFSILTHGRRTALPRHQTLRATLDWSYQLLSPEDRAALRCLSLFNGSFTLEDAAFVMGPLICFGEANDRLTSLLDKSLVVAKPEERRFRYRLLDTTRAYGQDMLEESGEANRQRRRHAQRFLERCHAPRKVDDEKALRQAMVDVRAALDWALVRGSDIALGLDLASAATPVFLQLSLLREHRKYLELALAHISSATDPKSITDMALRTETELRIAVAWALYYTDGPDPAIDDHLVKARSIAQKIDDKIQELRILWILHGIAGNAGNYRQELTYAREFGTVADTLADPMPKLCSHRFIGRGLGDLGQYMLAQEHIDLALRPTRDAVSQSTPNAYEIDNWVASHAVRARILWLRGYPDDAKTEAEECISDALQLGHEQSTCWAVAFNVCPVAIWRGDLAEARHYVNLLRKHSENIFQHYYGWALIYDQFLNGIALAPHRGNESPLAGLNPTLPAQADLLATFDISLAGLDSLTRAQADEEIWCAPEVLRAWAVRHISGTEAEAMLLHSFKLAQRQDAKAWELRTATTLALFYLRSNRIREARAVLEPTLKQFKQGHDTRDLQAAISVLSELSG